MTRQELKAACLAMLDQNTAEHPAGHQGKLAARYVLRSQSGERIGLMFEKSDKTKPLLWVEHRFLRDLVHDDIEFKVYLASSLYPAVEAGGNQPYRPSVIRYRRIEAISLKAPRIRLPEAVPH